MKNDIKINILNHGKVEIIDDEEFIQKLRNSKKCESLQRGSIGESSQDNVFEPVF